MCSCQNGSSADGRQVCGQSRAERVEVPQLQSVNSAEVSVGQQRQIPTVRTEQETVDSTQFLDKVVTCRCSTVPLLPSNDKVVDIFVVTQRRSLRSRRLEDDGDSTVATHRQDGRCPYCAGVHVPRVQISGVVNTSLSLCERVSCMRRLW